MDQWLSKINKLSAWQAAIVIALAGFVVFFTGLTNPFIGDDFGQIVDNVPVHSIANIHLFFEGGTFYNGRGTTPLTGAYYRPLMTTTFSLLYTLFGARPFYFHLLQLLLCIGSAIFLYLFFSFSFKPMLSLALALTFLVHPIDAQVVYAIPTMQDALYFFFGILALWLLLRFRSNKSLILVSISLMLSLLAKETGVLFVIMALMYLYWFDRKRLLPFVGVISLPSVVYLALKIHAVGLGSNPHNAPIDDLSLAGRLLTAPSILLSYVSKLIFPWKLASSYYWVNRSFSIQHVFIPLIVDLAILALVAYVAILIYKRGSKAHYLTFVFFSIWAALGLLIHLQIVPLDFTATNPWFYFSMAGVLGMIGTVIVAFAQIIPYRINIGIYTAIVSAVIVLFGIRTAAMGFVWKDAISVAQNDIASSKDQFNAYNQLADYYFLHADYAQAKVYAAKSVSIFPSGTNTNTLGASLYMLGDYADAYKVFNEGLKFGFISSFDNMAQLTAVYGKPIDNERFFLQSSTMFPQESKIWFYWAIQLYKDGYYSDAKLAINRAASLGKVQRPAYDGIINHHPFVVKTASKTVNIQ